MPTSSLTPPMTALALPLAISLLMTLKRPQIKADVRANRRLFLIVGLTIFFQAIHFVEELFTGLYIDFPVMFGYPPMEFSVFAWINIVLLIIWIISLLAVRRGVLIALFPLWFLGFAELLNLSLHPLAALIVGGYFPGLITGPVAGVFGVLTLRELLRVTELPGAQGEVAT